MVAGKQLLLEELSSDLQRKLNDLKKGEIVCVQGVKRRILNICANAVEM